MFSPHSYKFPAMVAVLLHALVISMMFVQWPQSRTIHEPVPQHVTAEIIKIESAAEKERKRKVDQHNKQKKQAAQRAEQQRKLAEQKKKEQIAKDVAEKKAKDAALKTKAEQDKKQKLAEQKKAEQQQQAEQELMEQLLEEQLAADQKAQEDAKKQAERATAIAADAMEKIRAHVSSHWRYPSIVSPDQEVTVHIQLVPTGEVIQVQIVKSSGNSALDRSVEQAIRKASPLPVPQDMRVFEKDFRSFTFKFRPENATW